MNYSDDMGYSDDEGSLLSTESVDKLRLHVIENEQHVNTTQQFTDDLKKVREYIEKLTDGTITEEEAQDLRDMKDSGRINELFLNYDGNKSLEENLDREIAQDEGLTQYFRKRVDFYRKRADEVEDRELVSDNSSDKVFDEDSDEMDMNSDEEKHDNSKKSNQSPTEYIAELESTLPGDFIGGGDD